MALDLIADQVANGKYDDAAIYTQRLGREMGNFDRMMDHMRFLDDKIDKLPGGGKNHAPLELKSEACMIRGILEDRDDG